MEQGDSISWMEVKRHKNGSMTLTKRTGKVLSIVASSNMAYVLCKGRKSYVRLDTVTG